LSKVIFTNKEPSLAQDRITVPHLSASALVAQAKEKLSLTYCCVDLASWNFITDECSKTYEVLTHCFGHNVRSDVVRGFFRERGFGGCTAAFIAWLIEKNPEGCYASIPEDVRLLRVPESRILIAPYFYRDDTYRKLLLDDIRFDWRGDCVFVAFRELPSST